MKKIKEINVVLGCGIVVLLSLLLKGCIETIPLETEGYEDLIVIEALLTTELKQHEIKVSRSYRFEDSAAVKEMNADVKVIDNGGGTFLFKESSPGTYISEEAFSPSQDRTFQLQIKTSTGGSYRSDFIKPTPPASFDRLYAERTINDNNSSGIGIFVESKGASDQPAFFQYEYEETFVLRSPFSNSLEVVPLGNKNKLEFDIQLKDFEDKICYKTDTSQHIILADSENQSNNEVKGFEVRFFNKIDYRIRNRYSIEVTQIAQSRDTHQFFQLLNSFSDSDNIFSQLQPGFIQGNMVSDIKTEEQVLGLFSISSIQRDRIFVNFKDFFPEEPLPDYHISCDPSSAVPKLEEELRAYEMLTEAKDKATFIEELKVKAAGLIRTENLRFFETFNLVEIDSTEKPTLIPVMMPEECVDCRIFGSNVKPDFWED